MINKKRVWIAVIIAYVAWSLHAISVLASGFLLLRISDVLISGDGVIYSFSVLWLLLALIVARFKLSVQRSEQAHELPAGMIGPKRLKNLLERFDIKVFQFESKKASAWAIPHIRTVAISHALLRRVLPPMISGVVAHEVGHIRFRRYVIIRVMILIQGLQMALWVPALPALALSLVAMFWIHPAVLLIIPIFVLLVVPLLLNAWASRREEYAADALASYYLDSVSPLTLLLLNFQNQEEQQSDQPQYIAFLNWPLFNTHPSHEKRIMALNKLQSK